MRITTWMTLALFALSAAACGGDDASGTGGSTATGGTGGTTSQGGGGMGGSGGTGGEGGMGGSGGQGGQGGGSGMACGGLAGEVCPTDEYCNYQPSTCGFDDGQGICETIPEPGCPDVYMPVCGCDGMVYGNGCEATAAGQDINTLGSCTAPQGYFACGHQFCDLAFSYCQVQISDVGGEDNGYECLPLPNGCGDTPDCACLAGETCGNMCDGTAQTGLTTTCPGG